MRLDNRRPGTSTTFVDAPSGEHVLQVATDEDAVVVIAYHLYDDRGVLVAQSAGLEELPLGLTILSDRGDLLLGIPPDIGGVIQYRLYSGNGTLLTYSDGVRTKICPNLRMEGVARLWARDS